MFGICLHTEKTTLQHWQYLMCVPEPAEIIIIVSQLDLFHNINWISQRTLTIFVGVVALRYQHHTTSGVDNGVPQLPQT